MTLYDMQSFLTIRLDDDLDNLLEKVCTRSGRKRSDVVRDALRRQLAVTAFDQLRSLACRMLKHRDF
jgi:predicted transcriptional regulator